MSLACAAAAPEMSVNRGDVIGMPCGRAAAALPCLPYGCLAYPSRLATPMPAARRGSDTSFRHGAWPRPGCMHLQTDDDGAAINAACKTCCAANCKHGAQTCATDCCAQETDLHAQGATLQLDAKCNCGQVFKVNGAATHTHLYFKINGQQQNKQK